MLGQYFWQMSWILHIVNCLYQFFSLYKHGNLLDGGECVSSLLVCVCVCVVVGLGVGLWEDLEAA